MTRKCDVIVLIVTHGQKYAAALGAQDEVQSAVVLEFSVREGGSTDELLRIIGAMRLSGVRGLIVAWCAQMISMPRSSRS